MHCTKEYRDGRGAVYTVVQYTVVLPRALKSILPRDGRVAAGGGTVIHVLGILLASPRP